MSRKPSSMLCGLGARASGRDGHPHRCGKHRPHTGPHLCGHPRCRYAWGRGFEAFPARHVPPKRDERGWKTVAAMVLDTVRAGERYRFNENTRTKGWERSTWW